MEITCIKCKKGKDQKEFNKSKSKTTKSGFQSYCKQCVRDISKKFYNDNKDNQKTKFKQRNKKRKIELNDLKEGLICIKCGDDRIYVLDFHHIDPSQKLFGISNHTARGHNLEVIELEIKKCVPLCSNCHREFHHFEREENLSLEKYLILTT